ncbi:MAG: GxxExxY protein [Anaerolineaceae bacterium]|nr:GxxExxY protein [Anaerolineaceae bacterium]
MQNPALLHRELTYQIIGAAIEVHKILGPGFLESVYQASLAREFSIREIEFLQQVPLPICYKGTSVGNYIADMVVDDKVVVELKAIKTLTDADEAQLINYLKLTGIKVGLLINFGSQSLQHIRRIV